jgi:hypothetical protein
MRLFMLFAHWVGLSLWIGGEVANLIVLAAAKREDPSIFGAVARIRVAILRKVVAPGALVTLLTGLILTIQRYYVELWLVVMQVAGFVGAIVVLLIAMPVGVKLSRIDPVGENVPYFLMLRGRLTAIGVVSLAVALLGLWAGVK